MKRTVWKRDINPFFFLIKCFLWIKFSKYGSCDCCFFKTGFWFGTKFEKGFAEIKLPDAKGRLSSWVEKNFFILRLLIFIGAVGIAVRAIAKHCQKNVSPAVMIIDDKGCFVIPILSGHIGQANFYAKKSQKNWRNSSYHHCNGPKSGLFCDWFLGGGTRFLYKISKK